MNWKIVCLLLLALPWSAPAQTESKSLLKLSNYSVSKEEFQRLYKKNNQNLQEDSLKKTPEEYLQLFINYKLKVLEAESLGMDTTVSFKKEFKQYRDQVAQPYLTYSKVTDENLQKAYQRSITELKAAHILVKISPNATENEQAAAYQRCLDIRKEIEDGAKFEAMAKQYSDDPSVSRNGGTLGYFTAFQMVPEFEDAAFELPVDSISMPVRTKFGYHLIQVTDKRPSKGQIRVAHIMKRLSPNPSEPELSKYTAFLDSLKSLALNGADFADLARNFSDDRQSAPGGGVIPWFAATGMVPEFAEAAFKLKTDGEISPVIRSPYGLHLIKRLELKPVPAYNELKDMLTEKLRNDPQLNRQKHEQFIQDLKEQYHFTENVSHTSSLYTQIETGMKNGKMLSETDIDPDDILFEFASQRQTESDFMNWLKLRKFSGERELRKQLSDLFQQFAEEKLLAYEDSRLEEKYPEFRYLVQEYHDGILLFNLSEKMVWNNAQQDSIGFEQFCAKNKGLFKWGPRFEGWVIQCNNQAVRDYIDEIFAEDPDISKDEMQDILNVDFQNQAFLQKDIFARGSNALVDYLVWNGPEPDNYVDGLHFVRGNLTTPAPKTMEEAKGQYLAAYQDYLEREWVKELRRKYPVKIDRKVLKTIETVK